MSKKINTSFKENDEDMKLYLTVMGANDRSAFIKDALKFYLKYRHLELYLEQLEQQQRINAITNAATNK